MSKKTLKITYLMIIGALLLLATGCATVSTSGGYTLESGRTLRGNLVITSGVATLEEGSRVTGNVLMTSGNLQVDGEIDGDIVMFSGNISLGPEAIVHGDIRGTSGTVQPAEGAQVLGQISTNQSAFRIGWGIFASLFALFCILPLVLIGGLILLVVAVRRGRRTSQPPVPAAQPQVPTPSEDPAQKLKQLKQMLDDGLIAEADYETKKAEILAAM